jgi:hypothetical protein
MRIVLRISPTRRRTVLGIKEPVSEAWERALIKCLEADTNHRPHDIAALAAAFGIPRSTPPIPVQSQPAAKVHTSVTAKPQPFGPKPTSKPPISPLASPPAGLPFAGSSLPIHLPPRQKRQVSRILVFLAILVILGGGMAYLSLKNQPSPNRASSLPTPSLKATPEPTPFHFSPGPGNPDSVFHMEPTVETTPSPFRATQDRSAETIPKDTRIMPVPTPSESPAETIGKAEQRTNEPPAPRASLVPPQTTTEDVVNFLDRHLNLEQQHDVRSSMQDYAPSVLYFDNGVVDQLFISKDKQDYFARWPVTHEQRVGEMSVSTLVADEKWSVTFRSSFRVENPTRREWVQGQVDCYYVVGRTDSGIKILTENGHVLERQKGTLASVSPEVQSREEQVVGKRAASPWSFPEMSDRLLTPNEVSKWDERKLYSARNEVFVRHGYIFSTPEGKAFAAPYGDAYVGVESDGNRVYNRLSPTEKANIALVKKFEKEALANGAPSTPLSQEPPYKSADQVEITRGRRRVYTVPELKELLGQRLGEAWLRGDFIVVQRLGNHAVLQSRADTARFGLELFESGKRMVFPGRTLVNLTLNREDGEMVSGNTVTFSESNPLRLTSVRKNAEGYTVVEAEF